MLHRAVREMGFNPTIAGRAESGLREAEHHLFDIAIIDLNLPGIGGLEMLERLREGQPDVQAIVLTGFGDLDAALRRDPAGCGGFSDQAVRAGNAGRIIGPRRDADGSRPAIPRTLSSQKRSLRRRLSHSANGSRLRNWSSGTSWRCWKRMTGTGPRRQRNWASVCASCIIGSVNTRNRGYCRDSNRHRAGLPARSDHLGTIQSHNQAVAAGGGAAGSRGRCARGGTPDLPQGRSRTLRCVLYAIVR